VAFEAASGRELPRAARPDARKDSMTDAQGAMVLVEDVARQLGPGTRFHCPRFEVAAGSQVALWGPSGCGKSTLLNLITGLLRPDTGRIIVDGEAIEGLREHQLDRFRGQRFGFVFQTFNLLGAFTALQNVLLGLRFSDTIPHKEWKPRARALLDRVGLSHRMHHKPATLSVGERQRVALARALANEPRILVADEPTGSLDPRTATDVMDLLLDLSREREVTLMLVTHDAGLADRLPETFDCSHLVTENAGGAP
jgi:ABC-type lipoprotein export system ATPase subunit